MYLAFNLSVQRNIALQSLLFSIPFPFQSCRCFYCLAWQFGFVYLFVVYVVVIWFILDLLVVILEQLKHLCMRRVRIISASGVYFTQDYDAL